MTIASGVGARAAIDGLDLSGNITQIQRLLMEAGQQNSTTLQDGAMRRTPTLRGGALDFTSLFDDDGDSGNGPHDQLGALGSADKVVQVLWSATRGAFGHALVAKQVSYTPDRPADGSLAVGVTTMANGTGVDGGRALTAGIENITAAANLAGVDWGVGVTTDFGLQAFLNVTGFTGTSATIAIEDSDDDGAGDAYAAVTGAGFSAVSAVGGQRIATGRTENVKRWTRLAVTGTFSSLDFSVLLCRNYAEVNF